MPPAKQHNTWAQAAGQSLNNGGNGSGSVGTAEMESGQENSGGSASKVMKMEEHVNESQLAAAFSEGWGQRGVNQDTAWDVPSSPQCSPKEGSSWPSTISTGTEIWENNVRHNNKCSNVSTPGQIREPWGHAPTTHIGGTWGEEEDNSNLWTGVPQNNSASWGNESSTSVWGTNPPDTKNWGNQNASAWGPGGDADDSGPDSGGNAAWADPANKAARSFGSWTSASGGNKKPPQPSGWEESAPVPAVPPATCQSVPHYDDGTAVWGNPVHQGKVSHWKEAAPSKQIQNCVMSPASLCGSGNQCAPHAGPGMIRLPPAATNMNKTENAWMKNQTLSRGLSWTDVPRDPSGRRIWDDIHNPLQDKNALGTPNTPNSAFGNWGDPSHSMGTGTYWGAKLKNSGCGWAEGQVDTSSWGGPMKQGGKPLSKDLIWASKQFRMLMEMNFKKEDIENALRRSNMNVEEAFLELHAMNSKENSMMEMEGLGGMNLNQSRVHHGNIADDLNFSDTSLDNSVPPGNLFGTNNFPNLTMFSSGFNVAQNCKTPKRKLLPQPKNTDVQSSSQGPIGNNSAPNILGSASATSQVPSFNLNNGINNLSPAMMRKILQQTTQTFNPACLPQNPLNNQTGRIGQQNFPSAAQLRHLVQQIQMAVQAGHLNPQILNQPLAPQTLQLLYQMLQQMRILNQLQQQQQLFYAQHGNKHSSPPLQLSVQITQAKQHLANLQNQIHSQQTMFLKQQQLQLPLQHPSLQTPQPSTFDVVKNLDSINGLHSDFRDLSIKDPGPQGHSRLNQWKMPFLEKDDHPPTSESSGREVNSSSSSSEFSRAPGPVSKSSSASNLSSATVSHSTSSNLQTLSENTWSDVARSQSDSWSETSDSMSGSNSAAGNSDKVAVSACDPTLSTSEGASNKPNSASDNKDSPATTATPSTSSSSQSSCNLNDLVPEFEPGKPWKGTSRIKNFEDDPHVTPGSVAKSPLSLNSIKDSELFTWNSKPNASSHNLSSATSLTSSTWTFSPPPPATTIQNSNVAPGKPGVVSKGWGTRSSDERMPWKGPSIPKTRGPPPGLTGQNKSISSNWMPGESGHHGWSSNSGWEKQSNSNFLVLRNLTPQIDGSTLKTLCMQHGPLQLFHLLLNHGIALVCYSSREETEKARSALNNCVLSNTTILVDIPTDAEVKQYLQLASGQMTANIAWPQGASSDAGFGGSNSYSLNSSTSNANTSGTAGKINSANWNINLPGSNLWSFSGSGNSLWGMQPATGDSDQCIPSSLNSFLPGDLLGGGESI